MKHFLEFFLIRTLTYPFAFFSYKMIHRLGKVFGYVAFYLLTDFRKKAMSNLAMAKKLQLSPKQIRKIAIESFQNMAINCLEMPKLSRETNLSKLVQCDNPETAKKLYDDGVGIVFFCGHQSNWDVLFLDGNTRMKGIAIGKDVKNPYLTKWIMSVREKNGGKIISPRQAIKEGLRALKKGIFVGIVGDQGMPDSGYHYPFLGRKAWNSTAPALLAYRTKSPIMVATTRRENGGYRTHYSDPIWPNTDEPMEKEVKRLMDRSLELFEKSVAQRPGEWLWQHNRWKQQTPDIVKRPFRKDCICLILPKEKKRFLRFNEIIGVFRKIYPEEHITLFLPKKFKNLCSFESTETIFYENLEEIFRNDYRFKLVFNFTENERISKHYLKLSALDAFSFEDLRNKAPSTLDDSGVLLEAITRSH